MESQYDSNDFESMANEEIRMYKESDREKANHHGPFDDPGKGKPEFFGSPDNKKEPKFVDRKNQQESLGPEPHYPLSNRLKDASHQALLLENDVKRTVDYSNMRREFKELIDLVLNRLVVRDEGEYHDKYVINKAAMNNIFAKAQKCNINFFRKMGNLK